VVVVVSIERWRNALKAGGGVAGYAAD
jgi:hypothetical protein